MSEPPEIDGACVQAGRVCLLETQEGRLIITRHRGGGYSVVDVLNRTVERVDSAHDVYDDIWPEAVTIIANMPKWE